MRTYPVRHCSEPECDRRYFCKGYCKFHYRRILHPFIPPVVQPDLEGEEWRQVVDDPDYQVSNLGRIRRATVASGTYIGRLLEPARTKDGYRHANFHGKMRLVYHLVAAAFIGARPAEQEINHKDGNKQNDAAANLEYVTGKQNSEHAWRNGLITVPRGMARVNSKLTDDAVRYIRTRPLSDDSALAEAYGVTRGAIRHVKQGRSWTHVV